MVRYHFVRDVVLFALLNTVLASLNPADMTSNLISDFSPLLSLFGEQFAKQFMSESTSWIDCLVFSLAPLGILTTIVGAIRVCGPSWLKALIGRARETFATAEMEIMSSTSYEVCECWNGNTIVRVMGVPKIFELLFFPDVYHSEEDEMEHRSFGLYTLEEAKTRAPNLSLNISSDTSNPDFELYVAALLGILIEGTVLLFAGFISYLSPITNRFLKGTSPNSFAFPLTCIGTLALTLGMFLCANVIEKASKETKWKPSSGAIKMLWLQSSKTVNDQLFDSYAIIAKGTRTQVNTSQRFEYSETDAEIEYERSHGRVWKFVCKIGRVKPDRYLAGYTLLGTMIGLVGFCLQFTGLRSLHFTVSILQLVATIFMTAVRAWLRRGLTKHPSSQKLQSQFELDWFATRF
ncbi:hypothetical protein BDD12DRAFT_941094, partial [Trichophaea hybrida]